MKEVILCAAIAFGIGAIGLSLVTAIRIIYEKYKNKENE